MMMICILPLELALVSSLSQKPLPDFQSHRRASGLCTGLVTATTSCIIETICFLWMRWHDENLSPINSTHMSMFIHTHHLPTYPQAHMYIALEFRCHIHCQVHARQSISALQIQNLPMEMILIHHFSYVVWLLLSALFMTFWFGGSICPCSIVWHLYLIYIYVTTGTLKPFCAS